MRKTHLGLLGFSVAVLIGIGCGDDSAPAKGGGDDEGSSSSSGDNGASSGGSSSSSSGGSSSSSGGSSTSSGGSSSSSGSTNSYPWLVQCFYGAQFGQATGSNIDIKAACGELPQQRVDDCAGTCDPAWKSTAASAAYDALFKQLDSNDDAKVDDADEPVNVALLGHSWGGTNVAQVGNQLNDDDRVAPSRKAIKLGMAWDPFKYPAADLLPAANFERFVVLRHTKTPAQDCSSSVPVVGPFLGFAPKCPAGQACEDYDYSAAPDTSFPAYPSGTIKGGNVDHCGAFNVGFPVAKAILDGTALPPLPPSVPVQAP